QKINYLRKIDPFVFEELLLEGFEAHGFRTIRNKRYTGDGGIDGQVIIGKYRYLIQAKRYRGHIALQHVQEFDDKYDDGTKKERVFDLERYNFTFNLLNIIKNIDHKLCLGSRRNLKANKVIRVEHRDKRNPKKGTYIVMKMKRFSSDSMGFTLYVETCHARNNMPPGIDLSNVERKHMLILGDWLKEQHEDVITEAKKP
ncbi:restriction endonuclease, partial [Enterobacter hormaechei subsp. steigerwaltii]|uniref:restriction endonuclease n=1 Tax=Enterobacter hormaechei TaxID=158836 RepID=UPI003F4317CC